MGHLGISLDAMAQQTKAFYREVSMGTAGEGEGGRGNGMARRASWGLLRLACANTPSAGGDDRCASTFPR